VDWARSRVEKEGLCRNKEKPTDSELQCGDGAIADRRGDRDVDFNFFIYRLTDEGKRAGESNTESPK